MRHLLRTYLLPPELEESLVADLWLAGTLGVRSEPGPAGKTLLHAYFPEGASPDAVEVPVGIELLEEQVLPEEDWLARWREGARPFAVGRSLFVDPREPGEAVEVPAGRRLLRLPARAAFGVGSHESTSLALELLEEMDLRGRRVLDVGAGTGVLSFAALLFGAASAVAFDVDLTAPFHARDNSRLNGLRPLHFAGATAALCEAPRFDLALVNVVPEEVLPELPGVVRRLAPGGELVFSGILAERGGQVLARTGALGLSELARRTAGDWIAFRLVRAG